MDVPPTLPAPEPTQPIPSRGEPETVTAVEHPPTETHLAVTPMATLGRYQLCRELGRGGMGVVYLAHDPALRREVALKVLLEGDLPDLQAVERFQREAAAAARLSHPNLVGIFDVGTESGRHYFTMEWVGGGTVADRLSREGRLPPHEAMRLVAEAAEGVAFAHAHGVIHRDLKPGNLLLEDSGRVKVSDFGIARVISLEAGQRLTHAGQIVGTPAYMAPEQAEGAAEETDGRNDVYSLGSILYELVTGVLPYGTGKPMEVLFRKFRDDPQPPRKKVPGLAPDVETIVLKAMEREPERRYASAQDLAADLRRCLAGEVIHARPVTPAYRAWNWLRRNRGVAAAASLAVAATVLGGGSAWLQAHRREIATQEAEASRRRLRQAEEAALGQLRRVSRIALHATLELRRHGIIAVNSPYLADLDAAVAEARAAAPTLAEPYYHSGRVRRALQQFDEALRLQEEALRRDPDFAPALYERALSLFRSCRTRLVELRSRESAQTGERLLRSGHLDSPETVPVVLTPAPSDHKLAADDPEITRHAAGILATVTRLERVLARGEGDVSPAQREIVRAGRLLHAGPGNAGAEAAALLERAIEQDPELEDAYELLAYVEVQSGHPERAIETLGRGIERDRGYVPFRLSRAAQLNTLAKQSGTTASQRENLLARALADCEEAVRLAPDPSSWTQRGVILAELTFHADSRGEDPLPLLERAERDFGSVIENLPDSFHAYRCRAALRAMRAWPKLERGESAEAELAAARQDFEHAAALEPTHAEPRSGAAIFYFNWGARLQNHGRDPRELYARADAEARAALALNPRMPVAWHVRGLQRECTAAWRWSIGEDPEPDFRGALSEYTESIRWAPDSSEFLLARARLQVTLATFHETLGKDPTPILEAAEHDLKQVLEARPTFALALTTRALAFLNLAAWRANRSVSPLDLIQRAEADLSIVLDADPAHGEAWSTRAQIRVLLGNWRGTHQEDPFGAYADAEADLEQALKIGPRHADACYLRGHLRANRGVLRMGRGEIPDGDFSGAEADLTRALELNPRHHRAAVARGKLRLDWAWSKRQRGEAVTDLWTGALSDFDLALRIHPRAVEACWRRGWALVFLERWGEAIQAFEAAQRADPDSLRHYERALRHALQQRDAPPKGTDK